MEPVQITEVTETRTLSLSIEKVAEFARFLEEDEEKDEEEPLMDGPVVVQLAPVQIPLKALQMALPNFAFLISPPFQSFSLSKTKRLGYSPIKQGKRQK